MKWFRSNIKRVSRMALLALGIQLALTFGHFHRIGPELTPALEFGAASSEFSAGLTTKVADSRSARQPASNPDSNGHPGDICAICAVMVMANSVLLASPPVLLLPQIVEFSYLATEGELARVASIRVAFQPRAPPIS